MPRIHSHPAHRNVIEQDKSDVPPLLAALKACLEEMKGIEDTACDHSVNVCWCSWHSAMSQAKKLIAAHERSEQWMKELD